jgi:hypothetical protein
MWRCCIGPEATYGVSNRQQMLQFSHKCMLSECTHRWLFHDWPEVYSLFEKTLISAKVRNRLHQYPHDSMSKNDCVWKSNGVVSTSLRYG